MWKISAIVREEDELDQLFLFSEVINFRKHLAMGSDYFANAFTQGTIRHVTRRMLLEMDLSQIVELVRDLADSYTREVKVNKFEIIGR